MKNFISMRLTYLTLFLFQLAFIQYACSQGPYFSDKQMCQDPSFDERVRKSLSFTVPVISVQHLKRNLDSYVILDAREKMEYEASHIPGAIFIGYNDFDMANTLKRIPKSKEILVYCSIGYRSEKIGEKLLKAGYQDVSNLYGSIFEWVNQGYPIENGAGKNTNEVHTYSKRWGRWVNNKTIKKVW